MATTETKPSIFQTHGAISWFELMTDDQQGAKDFYGKLFGWKFEKAPQSDTEYTLFSVAGEKVGGMMDMPASAPGMPPTWGMYVTVNNIDDTLAKVRQMGGTVLMGPQEVPKVGRLAVIQDPQGAAINVMQYQMTELK
jgi:predicted enzyme related to lactoylglutathione lyase